MSFIDVPYFTQGRKHTCGPACMRMLSAYSDMRVSEAVLVKHLGTTVKHGTTRAKMKLIGRRLLGATVHTDASWSDLRRAIKKDYPVIVNFRETGEDDGHYAVVVGVDDKDIVLNDPWHGEHVRIPNAEFKRRWLGYKNREKNRGWMMVLG